jgi:hypothetical protein
MSLTVMDIGRRAKRVELVTCLTCPARMKKGRRKHCRPCSDVHRAQTQNKHQRERRARARAEA